VRPEPIRVLVVEDDPIAARAHATYVDRVPGFVVVATVLTGADAVRHLSHPGTDLVLLDLNLPDMHGLEVCRAIRATGRRTDVIAVTSARDLAMVRSAVDHGVVQYLLKPFVFATLRERLERYATYRQELNRSAATVVGQHEVDRLLGGPGSGLRTPAENRMPKGMSRESLEIMITELRSAPKPLSAAETAGQVGMSRVSARRYLEYLCDVGLATRTSRYGGTGRPEIEYSWRG
jgi:response regulator of citrate/malate metabolism